MASIRQGRAEGQGGERGLHHPRVSPCASLPWKPAWRNPGGELPRASGFSRAQKEHSAVFPPQYSHKSQAVRVGLELMRAALRISAVTLLFQADLGEGDGYTFQDGKDAALLISSCPWHVFCRMYLLVDVPLWVCFSVLGLRWHFLCRP